MADNPKTLCFNRLAGRKHLKGSGPAAAGRILVFARCGRDPKSRIQPSAYSGARFL